MDKRLEALGKWGCDIDGAMERMLDDEQFYLDCLHIVAEDNSFAALKDALERADIEQAFDSAHALKGVLGNVGLTPMYKLAIDLVEPLRNGHCEGLLPMAERLLEMRDYLTELLAQ